jgi:hypothetical protein
MAHTLAARTNPGAAGTGATRPRRACTGPRHGPGAVLAGPPAGHDAREAVR